jgi:hypothetical protein
MSSATKTLNGIVHGRSIELAEEPGLPDGQEVTVTVQPKINQPVDGIALSGGACADEADDLDAYLAWTREQRKLGRKPIDS